MIVFETFNETSKKMKELFEMEGLWTSTSLFATQFIGNAATDLFYGQEITDPGLLLANAAASAVGSLVTGQVMAAGSILYFLNRDAAANKGKLKHTAQDMYEGIGAALVVGATANVAVRHLFFGVPLQPALVAGAVGVGLTWLVYVQPTMNKLMPRRN